jgi:Domain of unknown function (DUF4265)
MSEPHDHVRLLAGVNSRGNPVYEVVPAVAVEAGVFEVLGTPALAFGCAAGDRIRVAEDGSFEVVGRGGNVAAVIFPRASVDDADLAELSAVLDELEGVAESPEDGRFVVVTVPVSATFSAIESAVDDWARRHDAEWSFSNVYDSDDQPINWWSPTT